MIIFDIDTQHDFMHRDGALYVPGADEIRAQIERLLEAAGSSGVTTISSRCAHGPDDPEFEIFPPHCIDGTVGAERIFHLKVEDLPLTVLSGEKVRPAEGSIIGVTVPPGALHLFDSQTGRRIAPVAVEAKAPVPA